MPHKYKQSAQIFRNFFLTLSPRTRIRLLVLPKDMLSTAYFGPLLKWKAHSQAAQVGSNRVDPRTTLSYLCVRFLHSCSEVLNDVITLPISHTCSHSPIRPKYKPLLHLHSVPDCPLFSHDSPLYFILSACLFLPRPAFFVCCPVNLPAFRLMILSLSLLFSQCPGMNWKPGWFWSQVCWRSSLDWQSSAGRTPLRAVPKPTTSPWISLSGLWHGWLA